MQSILPYMEEVGLYNQFDLKKGYADNLEPARTRVRYFVCPISKEAAEGQGMTSYVALSGIELDAAERLAGGPATASWATTASPPSR